jgi:hypothetical protein
VFAALDVITVAPLPSASHSAAPLLVAVRAPVRIRPRTWRIAYSGLAVVIALDSVAHALLIEGSMGQMSRAVLCVLVLAGLISVLIDLHTWTLLTRRRG